MRFFKLPNDLITDSNITSNEFRIYVYLMSLYNRAKGFSYPSIETISKDTNISVSTVKRSIKKLFDLGYMAIEKRKGMSGNYNIYKNFKYLILSDFNKNKIFSHSKSDVKKEVQDIKKAAEIEKNELLPFTIEHQQKISLVLKQNVKLTEKQMWLLGEFQIEPLREAIRLFKKETRTNSFAFLIDTYYTACSRYGIIPSKNIQKYCGKKFLGLLNREAVKPFMDHSYYAI